MNYNEQYEKNMEILSGFEKVAKEIGSKHSVHFKIKDRDRKLNEVSKEEFARWMINEKEKDDKEQIEKSKESLVYGVKWDIDGLTYFMERKDKNGVIKESYYQPRSEEEKKQIIERNRKRREQEKTQTEISATGQDKENELVKEINQEKTQTETSPNSNKKDQKSKREINNFNISSKNKSGSVGKIVAVSGVLLIVGVRLYYWIKPKKIKK